MSAPVPPSRCPLCGQPNQCAQCDPSAAQPCWCFSTRIPRQIRASIPQEARNKACICARCADGSTAPEH
ncbi:cysteine-rich CWC family protein [Pseudomonas lopnurensis]|uniref:cysteine-rich CWC family protein n=1 Tax=Pseudomonas lopnurensis TaxID=1477517 RepID=UPI0018798F20|nr:cysteine-rich CWC family protein [Pseudomonas lopnurensis]MBE7374431.1 cysteine-rich CWC family protein [Pseudomonas lopnurensis]